MKNILDKDSMIEKVSCIVTPPNFIDNDEEHAVIILDPDWSEIEDLIFYFRVIDKKFNVYVYKSDMKNEEWLHTAIKKSQAYIINTINTDISNFKDKLVSNPKSFYYGPKRFLASQKQIEKPIDYFTQTLKKETNVIS